MKVKSLLVGMMACVALGACTNQDLVEGEIGNGNNADSKAYIGIKIVEPAGSISRAASDDFTDGSEEEHKISNAFFVFYTNGTNPIEGKTVAGLGTSGNDAPSIEATSNAVLALDNINPDQLPNQVVAFINLPDEVATKIKGMTLSAAMNYVAELSEIENFAIDDNFIMTNSVYLSGSDIKCATDVKATDFAQTEASALSNPVNIYVERLAAKVGMAWKDGTENMTDQKINKEDGEYTLRLNVDGWALNGTNRDAYLLKNIDATWTNTNLFPAWNEESNKRSYWAMDNNYANGTYPNSYDDYANSYDKNTTLDYKSWEEIKTIGTVPQYCLENTVDAALAANVNATTHMIIAGHYDLYKGNDKVDVKALYKYNLLYYTEEELITNMVSRYSNAGGIYTKTGDASYDEVKADQYELAESTKAGEAKLVFNGNANTTYYKKVAEAYEEYTDVAAINKSILDELSTATAYRDGLKTYFYTTIKHLNETEGGLGHIGIVRNHIYNLTLNKIEKMGHGVFDPSHEIIIEKEDKEYFVGATLNILAWKNVNQGVDL